MRIFIDSSALAKRYIQEPGTETVLSICNNATEVILSALSSVEIISALNRRVREKSLPKRLYRKIKADFARDLEGATIVEVYPLLIQEAVRCLERCPMRALDALQLAAAIVSQCDSFLTSDDQQAAGARVMGINVILVLC